MRLVWADGSLGDFSGSEVMLSDYIRIEELCDLLKPQFLAKLNSMLPDV
jgi:hypothetical protein